jgi:hypothetical protein
MTDWAGWGTGIGTLVLAGATLVAVRSSNRSARIAERALLVGMRPMLSTARHGDPAEEVQFADGRVFGLDSSQALVRHDDHAIYLAIPLRNVGSGIAQLRGYHLDSESADQVAQDARGPARHLRGDLPPDASDFAEQQRDIYVAAGELGFWQAALRDPHARSYSATAEAVRTNGRITVDLLYGDHEGGQQTITRFVLLADTEGRWRCDVTRYWSLDDPSGAGSNRADS